MNTIIACPVILRAKYLIPDLGSISEKIPITLFASVFLFVKLG
jgi:hypothetical protein